MAKILKSNKVVSLFIITIILGLIFHLLSQEYRSLKNIHAVEVIKNTFSSSSRLAFDLDILSLPSYSIDGQDYVGYINIGRDEVAIKKEELEKNIIWGNNLRFGFSQANAYNEGELLSFVATNGNVYRYRVTTVEHKKPDLLDKPNSSLVIAIRNYLNFDWITLYVESYIQ